MRKSATKISAKTKTVAYDVAEQLRTPKEMAAYLDAWLTEAPDDASEHCSRQRNVAGRQGCGPEPGEPVQSAG